MKTTPVSFALYLLISSLSGEIRNSGGMSRLGRVGVGEARVSDFFYKESK